MPSGALRHSVVVPVESSESDGKNYSSPSKGAIADASLKLTSRTSGSTAYKPRVSVSTSASSGSRQTNAASSERSQQLEQPTARQSVKGATNIAVVSDIFTLQGEVEEQGKEHYLWRKLPIWRFNSHFIRQWHVFLMLVSIWTFGWVPLSWSFDQRGLTADMQSIYVFDRCLDVLYCMVPLVRMRTTVCDVLGGKEWAGPPLKIFRMALKDRTFHLDVLSMVPILADIFNGTNWTKPGVSWAPPLKLCRAHRILFIPTSHIEAEFSIYILLTRLFLWVFLISHLMACLWYSLVTASDTLHYHLDYNYLPTIDCLPPSSDVEQHSLKPAYYHSYHNAHISPTTDACQSSMDQIWLSTLYLLSLREGVYIFLGRVRPAFSDTEMAFLGLFGPIGGLLLAVISGQSTVLLQRIDAVARKHHEHMTFIRGAMKSLRLPQDLTVRIESYHHFLAIHHDLNSYSSIFQGLSMQLFTELKAHIYNALFRTAPFFRNACKEFVNYIVLALEEISCSPGDNVVTQGEIGHEMYWILRGRCEVVESLRVVAQLSENQFFGEIALLVQTPRLCTVRAATYCLLAMITRDNFLPIIDQFPEQKKLMVDRIQTYSMHNTGNSHISEEDEHEHKADDGEEADGNLDDVSCSEQNSARQTQMSQRFPTAVQESSGLRRASRLSHMSADGERHSRITLRRDRASRPTTHLDMTLENEVKRLGNEAVESRGLVVQFEDEDESISPNTNRNSSIFANAMATLNEVAGFTRRSTISAANLSFQANKHRVSTLAMQKGRASVFTGSSFPGALKGASFKARSNSVYSITSSSVGDIGDNGFRCSHFATSKNNMLKDIKEQVDELEDSQAEVAARVETIEHLLVDGFAKLYELVDKRLPPAATHDASAGSRDDVPDARRTSVELWRNGSFVESKEDLPSVRKSDMDSRASRQGSKTGLETTSRCSEDPPTLEVDTVSTPAPPAVA